VLNAVRIRIRATIKDFTVMLALAHEIKYYLKGQAPARIVELLAVDVTIKSITEICVGIILTA